MGTEGQKPDVVKCRDCIFFRIYPGIRCLQGGKGDETIRAGSRWFPDKIVPSNTYPGCQEEAAAASALQS